MSKLPQAPLIEVIFELRWTITPQETQEIQYLHGDLYPLIKDEYPFRETLQTFPIEFLLNAPTHRFRKAANDYPLVQIGPGLLTINTIDSKYFWEDYEEKILDAIGKLQRVYTFKESHSIRLVLQYIDLVNFDFEREDIISFLKENLNVVVSQEFYSQKPVTKGLAINFIFENELGTLNVSFNRGKNLKNEEGIAIQTNITSHEVNVRTMDVKNWLEKAHELCSQLFKQMTKGKLYKEFSLKS
jgi:uncharacterized protein (TIGR04255 family)